jgi:Rad52/22 family double-strand break repair protein
VLGPANWWDDYVPQENSVICRLSIRMPDGSTLTKSDAGGYAGMSDSGDDDKSGFSDAFKRAAVKFGIGRYLYRDGVPHFVRERHQQPTFGTDPSHHAATKAQHPAQPGRVQAQGSGSASDGHGLGPPKTGKALFAWVKQQDEKHGYGLLEHISNWAKKRDFPARMVQWAPEQVQQAFTEAMSAVQATQTTQQEPPLLADSPADNRNDPRTPTGAGVESAVRPPGSARAPSASKKDREPSQPRPVKNR